MPSSLECLEESARRGTVHQHAVVTVVSCDDRAQISAYLWVGGVQALLQFGSNIRHAIRVSLQMLRAFAHQIPAHFSPGVALPSPPPRSILATVSRALGRRSALLGRGIPYLTGIGARVRNGHLPIPPGRRIRPTWPAWLSPPRRACGLLPGCAWFPAPARGRSASAAWLHSPAARTHLGTRT